MFGQDDQPTSNTCLFLTSVDGRPAPPMRGQLRRQAQREKLAVSGWNSSKAMFIIGGGELKSSFILAFSKIDFYLYVLCLYECVSTACVPAACRGQRRVLDPLELELQMVVSCLVGVES